jgi:hypothetical protein
VILLVDPRPFDQMLRHQDTYVVHLSIQYVQRQNRRDCKKVLDNITVRVESRKHATALRLQGEFGLKNLVGIFPWHSEYVCVDVGVIEYVCVDVDVDVIEYENTISRPFSRETFPALFCVSVSVD